jgi:hypothetical protein
LRVAALDRILPTYDRNEVHSIAVGAPPDRVMAAVQAVTAREIRLFATLNWLRGFRAARLRELGVSDPLGIPVLEMAARAGFVELVRNDREVVWSVVGRFWRPTGGRADGVRDAASFVAFAEPGTAKAAVDFRIEDATDASCVLRTETRILGVDAGARRRFKVYWFFVHPGSALMRRMWLRAVKKRAEAQPPSGAIIAA